MTRRVRVSRGPAFLTGTRRRGSSRTTTRGNRVNRPFEETASMSESQGARLRPITEVAGDLQLAAEDLEPYGRDKAKVRLDALQRAEASRPPGRLILVSAITPTPAGEGKTTTSIGLAQGLRRIGQHASL